MEYKVGYIRVFSSYWQDWTVGMIYEDNLHFYSFGNNVIRILTGDKARNRHVENPAGLSIFTDKDEAIKCFEKTIKVFKEKQQRKRAELKKKITKNSTEKMTILRTILLFVFVLLLFITFIAPRELNEKNPLHLMISFICLILFSFLCTVYYFFYKEYQKTNSVLDWWILVVTGMLVVPPLVILCVPIIIFKFFCWIFCLFCWIFGVVDEAMEN